MATRRGRNFADRLMLGTVMEVAPEKGTVCRVSMPCPIGRASVRLERWRRWRCWAEATWASLIKSIQKR